ncbi:MAG TPA: transglutaminase domain-containing protein [Verrucomicrobiae bacterium]
MKPPPLILGVALLFWGWRADMVAVAAVAAGLLELSNGIKARWDFTDKEFNRLWDVCTVIFLVVAAYMRFAEEVTSGAYKFFQWMPLIFFLMALGHMYALREGVPIKAFSWFMRRKGATGGDRPIAFGWVYFVVCLITAGATNQRDIWYYIGFALLTGWALWSTQPRRIPSWAWAMMFLVVATAGFYGQARMQELQSFMEEKASELFVRFGRKEFDPNQSQTAMGKIGSLKQSSRVALKVKAEIGPLPERLRQATYMTFQNGNAWKGGQQRGFEPVQVEPDLTSWNLRTNVDVHSAVRIVERVTRKSALLSVPMGTLQFRDLAVGAVTTNRLAAVRTEENPGLLDYSAHYGNVFVEQPPLLDTRYDMDVPGEEKETIAKIAKELKIDDLPERDKALAIVRFFQEKFRYTTYQRARELGLHAQTPLAEFLLKTRAGHCEYFASATVLLLREFEIPARYVTGYAVPLDEREGDFFVVRDRHAHAWAVAYVEGKWVEVDSTPAGWENAEEKEFPAYQPLKDWWERFTFGFLEWRWLGDWSVMRIVAPFLAAPLIGFLAWRIFGRKMFRGKKRPREMQAWPGADSEYFLLEKRLVKAGLARANEETSAEWLRRIAMETPGLAESLRKIVRIHYKYRFNPDGIENSEREELRRLVRACLARGSSL